MTKPDNNHETAPGAAASAALPMDVVLETLAGSLEDRRARRAIEQVSASLQRGATLDEALAKVDRTAPRYVGGLLRAATESGNMAAVCDGFLQLRESSLRASTLMRSILLYPIVLGMAVTGLAFLFSLWLMPMFRELFDEFQLELPPFTKSILDSAPFVPWLLLAAAAFFAAVSQAHRLRGALPIVGQLYTNTGQQQFASLLGNFVQLRLPMGKALTYTGDLLADRNLSRAAHRAAASVERGNSLSQSMDVSKHFDRSLTALVRWGEERSQLVKTLQLAAEMLDDRTRQRTLFLQRIIPTAALVMVAASALAVAAALLIPLVNLVEGLN